MFSIISIELSGLSFGGEVAAIGQLGMGTGPVTKDQVSELIVPWQPLQKDAGVFSLLSWHSRVSDFDGRHGEMSELERWAESNLPVSVKFVIGDGGVGKSRLGAEFAEHMQSKKWSSGFVDLKNPRAFQMKKKGTMLVIDYPEEHADKVKDLLHDLTTVGFTAKLRVLFLTRQTPERWEEVISLANARNIVDKNFLLLGRLDAPSAKTIFDSTALRAGEQMKSVGEDELGPAPIPVEAMEEWLKLTPANDRALFIMAAAVHSAENPDDELVSYDSRQVILALVDREVERYMRVAENNGYQDSFVYARLAAMAAIAGDLSLDSIKAMVNNPLLELGLDNATYLGQELERAGLLIEGKLVPPKPDIMAAAFVVVVFGKTPMAAPELVWYSLTQDFAAGMDRVSRLAYDSEVILGISLPRVQEWLSCAVRMSEDRSGRALAICDTAVWRYGWIEVSVVAGRKLLELTQDEAERARLLSNLSTSLGDMGEKEEALKVIKEAVEICRRLVRANPAASEPDLAMNLHNLSAHLSNTGELAAALDAINEAIDIRRRLAKANPDIFEPGLAMSLSNLSVYLSYTGNRATALNAIKEAVDIRRRLAKANPAVFEPGLAVSLNNLSNGLSDSGDRAAALDAIKEAVDIRRRLSIATPSAFEPDLAMGLHNLSLRLNDTGDRPAALDAIKEAVDIRRRLARANSGAFAPDLAISLVVYGRLLLGSGESERGKELFREGAMCVKPYAERFPNSRAADLLRWLESRLAEEQSIT